MRREAEVEYLPFAVLGVFMKTVISGRVQPGKNDASHWLDKFNEPYSKKTGMAIFPGSLNLALNENFDWFQPAYQYLHGDGVAKSLSFGTYRELALLSHIPRRGTS